MRYFVVPSGEEGKTCCHQRGCEALSRFSQSSKGNVNCKKIRTIYSLHFREKDDSEVYA
jgi:hypothetical protein